MCRQLLFKAWLPCLMPKNLRRHVLRFALDQMHVILAAKTPRIDHVRIFRTERGQGEPPISDAMPCHRSGHHRLAPC